MSNARNPIMPDGIRGDMLPPHLRRKPKPKRVSQPYSQKEIIRILKGFGDDIWRLQTAIAQGHLQANSYFALKVNSTKWRISSAYKMYNTNFTLASDHIVKFDEEVYIGDKGRYDQSSDWTYTCGLTGKYQINAHLNLQFQDNGGSDKRSLAELYLGTVATTFSYEAIRIYLFSKSKNSEIETLAWHPCRVANYTNLDYYYPTSIGLSGSTIAYLEAGERIDLRLNFQQWVMVGDPAIDIGGHISLHFIDDIASNI